MAQPDNVGARSVSPSNSVRWIKLTDRRTELLVISEIVAWTSHWDVHANRSRRCGGSDCAFCAMGATHNRRWVLMALDSGLRECLLELREAQREKVQQLYQEYGTLVGVRLRLRKEGKASNSPVFLEGIGREFAVARDITRLVETLGLPPITIGHAMNVDRST